MNKLLIVVLFGLLISGNAFAQKVNCCTLKDAPVEEQQKAGCLESDIAACKRLGQDVPEDRVCTVCTGQTINEKTDVIGSDSKVIIPPAKSETE